jgi:hypothetical protein
MERASYQEMEQLLREKAFIKTENSNQERTAVNKENVYSKRKELSREK